MTKAMAAAVQGLKTNAPWKTRNSPTKPARPGRPTEAKTKKPSAAE